MSKDIEMRSNNFIRMNQENDTQMFEGGSQALEYEYTRKTKCWATGLVLQVILGIVAQIVFVIYVAPGVACLLGFVPAMGFVQLIITNLSVGIKPIASMSDGSLRRFHPSPLNSTSHFISRLQ